MLRWWCIDIMIPEVGGRGGAQIDVCCIFSSLQNKCQLYADCQVGMLALEIIASQLGS